VTAKKKTERLGDAARRISPAEAEDAIRRTARLEMILTPAQKDRIREAAERYGLSMTDLILRCVDLVLAKAGMMAARVGKREP
jgi:hypothetical protein